MHSRVVSHHKFLNWRYTTKRYVVAPRRRCLSDISCISLFPRMPPENKLVKGCHYRVFHVGLMWKAGSKAMPRVLGVTQVSAVEPSNNIESRQWICANSGKCPPALLPKHLRRACKGPSYTGKESASWTRGAFLLAEHHYLHRIGPNKRSSYECCSKRSH